MISITPANQIDGALAVLADPTRRRIVELLGDGPKTATRIHREFAIAGPAVSRHLRVLREAGLVEERRVPEDGRVRVYVLRPGPLEGLNAWVGAITAGWQAQLDSFRSHVQLRSAKGETR